MIARTRARYQQIHERIECIERSERGDSLRAIARELHLSRGTVLRFARAINAEQLEAVRPRPIMCGAG
ncbi:helix-turn-helix domain-containing protein [Streptomyces mirabilis]|uniref:helix-turn-helix domain-containing protein n=1 Tax=Streptomyces mirabilis TaxID=68239 RepID=UPI00368DA6AB